MARFGDTYELTARADLGALDDAADALLRNAQATDKVGDAADRVEGDVRGAARSFDELDDRADRARNTLDDLDDAADGAGGSIGGAGDDAADAGGKFSILDGLAGKALKTLLGFAGISAISIGAIFGAGFDQFTAWDTAMNRFEARTGSYADEMEGYRDVAQAIYTSNWGESIDDVADAMANVIQVMGRDEPDDVLQGLVTDALILRDVFDLDVTESVRGVHKVMQQFGTEGGLAFDYVTRAMQFAGDPAGDLLDTLNEYSSTFKDMGFSADEMFAILTSGTYAGAYNYDVVADAVREMNIRLQDGTSDLALWSMGLDGMKQSWMNGETSAADFFQEVISGLRDIEDPMARQRAGVEIFGTKWEDIGDEVFLSLDTYSDLFWDAENATAAAGETMSRGLIPAWNQFKRVVMTGLTNALSPYIEAFLRQLIPAMKDMGAWLNTTGIPKLVEFTSGFMGAARGAAEFVRNLRPESLAMIGAALAAWAAPAVIGAIVTGLGAMASGFLAVWASAGPLVLLFGAIAAYETNFGGLRDAVGETVDALKRGDWRGAAEGIGRSLMAIPKGLAREIGKLLGINVPTGLKAWTNNFAMLGEIMAVVSALVMDKTAGIRRAIMALVTAGTDMVAGLIGAFQSGGLAGAWDWLKNLFSTGAADLLAMMIEKGPGIATGLLGAILDGLGDVVAWIGSNISGPMGSALDAAIAAGGAVLEAAAKYGPGILGAVLAGLGDVAVWIGTNLINLWAAELDLAIAAGGLILTAVAKYGPGILQAVLNGLGDVAVWFRINFIHILRAVLEAAIGAGGLVLSAIQKYGPALLQAILNGLGDLAVWFRINFVHIMAGVLDAAISAGGAILVAVAKYGPGILKAIKDGLGNLIEWTTTNIVNLIRTALTIGIAAGGVIMNVLASFGPNLFNAIVASLGDIAAWVNENIIQKFVDALKGLGVAIIDGINDAIPNDFSFTIPLGVLGDQTISADIADNPIPGGSRDRGGSGWPNWAYVINPSAGPEVFIPHTNGTFIPNADRVLAGTGAGGGGGVNLYGPVNLYGVTNIQKMYDELAKVKRTRGGRD